MSCPKLLLKLQILKFAYVAIVLMVSKMFRGLTSEWNAIHKHDIIVIKLQKISIVYVCLNYIGLIRSKERLNIAAVVMNQEKIK